MGELRSLRKAVTEAAVEVRFYVGDLEFALRVLGRRMHG